MARAGGAQVSVLDLRALALPVYDGDLEAAAGIPAGAQALLDALLASDAMLVVTPEYNGFPTPLVINAFDWLLRIPAQAQRASGLAATANKPVARLAASRRPSKSNPTASIHTGELAAMSPTVLHRVAGADAKQPDQHKVASA